MSTENNIYKALKRNKAITIGTVILGCITIISSFVFAFSVYVYQMNHALTIDKNGDILPLRYININDALKIRSAHHVEMFLKYFYQYDKTSFESQMQKALWLADESAENIYLLLQNENWFEKVMQYNLIQEIEVKPDNIFIEGDKVPFTFKASCIVRVIQQGQAKSYQLECSGVISKVHENYPLNPHGFLISEYKELVKTEIENGQGY